MRFTPAASLLLAACRAAPIPEAQRFPAGTPYRAQEIVLERTRIRYIDVGAGAAANAPTVVLIHGFGASMYSWRRNLTPVAAAGFRVVAFDNRGFGFSDRPPTGYTNAEYARLVVALLDSLRIPEAVLVGHSMGGAIAAEVALTHPERVQGLALLDPAGFGVWQPRLYRVARWPIVGALATGLRGRGFTARLLRSTYADPTKVTEGDVDQYYAPVAQPDYGRALRGALREFRFDALQGRLAAVQAPTLVLWGEQDRLIAPALGARLAAELPRGALVVLPGAGHAIQEEVPDAVNRLLITFLTEGLPRVPADLASAEEGVGVACRSSS
ncbi:MAG: alpha/beta fold hydrolase [Gemmatimonadales bacterium]